MTYQRPRHEALAELKQLDRSLGIFDSRERVLNDKAKAFRAHMARRRAEVAAEIAALDAAAIAAEDTAA